MEYPKLGAFGRFDSNDGVVVEEVFHYRISRDGILDKDVVRFLVELDGNEDN